MKLRLRVALALLMPAVVAAQAPQDRPTFRSGVEYVEVDVFVTDKKGNAVRDLTEGDFTILEEDPMEVDPKHLKDIPIWGTVLSGKPFQAKQQ